MNWLLLFALFSSLASAHKNHHHGASGGETKPLKAQLLNQVSKTYNDQVRPIFLKKCMDCHSSQTHYPWYYKLPFAKGLIDQDIKEAREHLDIGEGFPFRGHGDPISDLEEIARVVKDGSMPPPRYRILHLSAGFTEEERREVLRWVDESLRLLKGK